MTGPGGGFHADSESLERLSSTLHASTRAIDDATETPPAGADAGPSTPQVQDMISQLTKAASGLRGGLEQAANHVADSAKTYEKSDHAGQQRLSGHDGHHGGH